ncbi:hypothetical protein [Gynuella sunshinyii]|uniref:Uncharacterized protein n=1 Tax=Gynuella sunshinyii YC6258 TaxID=1445510 RepID=A0A0C5VNX0_9GAMM|nr:hypothetical protein [Gynuella sunshinyii]AJQ96001.1 hypothetical Protein YC6258_03965 [Gynuella sunshinyii YC6258]
MNNTWLLMAKTFHKSILDRNYRMSVEPWPQVRIESGVSTEK